MPLLPAPFPVPAERPASAPLAGRRLRAPLTRLLAAAGLLAAIAPALAQTASPDTPPAATAASPITRSALDGVLFYQLFVSELELRDGNAALAYQVMMEAARRSHDEALYRRAVDIALGAQAGEQAAAALKQWRQALPQSRQAAEIETQMLIALGRQAEARRSLEAFLALTPEPAQPAALASLPRLVLGGDSPQPTARMLEETLAPWRQRTGTAASALNATATAWLIAGDRGRSLSFVTQAIQRDAADPAAALLAVELMRDQPAAEALVRAHLASPAPTATVRSAYVRRLSTAQRYGEALTESRRLTRDTPDDPAAWLLQGALELEGGDPRATRDALQRYLQLSDARAAAQAAPPQPSDDDGDDDATADPAGQNARQGPDQERTQAYLMLAQASEQLRDYAAAQQWLERLADQDTVTVLTRRASLLMRQGRLAEARALLQRLPQSSAEEQRARVLTEAQLLREARQWKTAHELLAEANRRFSDDAELLYEQALLAEKLARHDEMESLLRRVMALKPDQQHAFNALGYSLAERNLRLPEARDLIARALEMAPGDPYITDSLGWVEFRLGRRDEAARLLGEAYRQRPDTEIGAHLGEVLWALGRQDEARRIWRESLDRDADNEVLQETLRRLRVKP
ncbi:MAG: hypothetical protein RLZZ592_38 [Pseudomonadota bacterium]|nr:hypothetical protein [Pseudomonadota bacterium]